MSFIIMDFDGTLANTFDLSLDILNDIVDDFGLPHFTEEQIVRARSMHVSQALREHGFKATQVALASVAFQRKLEAHKVKLVPIKGIKDAVLELSKLHDLSIVSSNNTSFIKEFLEKFGMNYFDPIVGGVSLLGKSSKIKKLVKSFRTDLANCIYVGDEVRDVEAARKVGIKVVSVTWGFNDRNSLEKARPDRIVDDPVELIPLTYSAMGGSGT